MRRAAGAAAFALAIVSSILSVTATNSDDDGSGLRVLRYAVGLLFLVALTLWVVAIVRENRARRDG